MSFAVVAVIQKHSVVCGMVSLRCRWKYFKDRLVVEPPFGWFLVQCQCKPSAGSLLYAGARPDIAVWLLITVQRYGASAQDYCVDGNIFWKKWFFVCIFGVGSVLCCAGVFGCEHPTLFTGWGMLLCEEIEHTVMALKRLDVFDAHPIFV